MIEKRKPGGQPGNQNGRTHGLYSKVERLTPREKQFFHSALEVPGIDREVAFLCTRAAFILAYTPDSYRAFSSILALLYYLRGRDRQKMVQTLKDVLHTEWAEQLFPGLHNSLSINNSRSV